MGPEYWALAGYLACAIAAAGGFAAAWFGQASRVKSAHEDTDRVREDLELEKARREADGRQHKRDLASFKRRAESLARNPDSGLSLDDAWLLFEADTGHTTGATHAPAGGAAGPEPVDQPVPPAGAVNA